MTIAAREQRHTGTDETGEAGFAIQVEGMHVRFARGAAIRDLALHVPWGSVYGLVGPSGAGKSITLRTLATLQPADAGTIMVDGIDVRTDAAKVRRCVGYLPDSFGLYEDLTMREYLDFCGAIYGVPARQRRRLTDELLELVDLTAQGNQPVKGLSRSMRQQLGLARCLIHDPPILLLDEPAAGVAPRARLELRDILQELSRLGKTMVISSNQLGELAEVCTHFGVIRDGALAAEGSVTDIMEAIPPDLQLRVRVTAPRDTFAAKRVLDAHPLCWQTESDNVGTIRAHFAGSETDLAALLSDLQRTAVGVSEFAVERPRLEDIVLQLSEMKLDR